MSKGFYSSKTFFGLPNALILLMIIFFLVPFALRGARMALQKTENNVKDWLPADFRETEELAWFAKHFVSEQFVAATWPGCTEDSQRLQMFLAKLESELASPARDSDQATELDLVRETLKDYVLFLDKEEYFNWGGMQEKWLVDENHRRYYITPNGRLYRWDGGANVIGLLGRTIARASGSFRLEGSFVAAFGKPSTDETPNAYWTNPRLLTTPLFKSVETGPEVVQQLAGPGKGLYVESNPTAGKRMAIARLTGTLFGPPVPANFSWQSADLEKLLPEQTRSQLPQSWPEVWKQVVQQAVDEKYSGDLQLLQKADPVDQSEVWYAFFDAVAVPEPTRQTCVILTLTEAARRNLGRVIGRGVLGQPTGRVFELAEECGVSAPPKPIMAPPPFSWLVQKPAVVEPAIRLGGPPVDNVAIDEEGTITLVRLIGYSLALGLFLSYILLRSFRLTLMVFFVGGVSAMTSMSLVWWGGASVDAILLTMPSLVYVLGISGAIHIVNYYRDAAKQFGVENAPERAISHAFMPCLLASVTTAIGLLSLCNSNILPISKFGLFSALGVMATLVLLYLYLPSALTIFPPGPAFLSGSSKQINLHIAAFWNAVGKFIIRRHWYVNAALFSLMIGMAFGLLKIQTSVQLLKMFDKDSQIISDYHWLESNFGRLVPMELVVRFPAELQAPVAKPEELSEGELKQARTKLTLLERAEAVRKIQEVLQDQFGYAGKNIIGRGVSGVTFIRDLPQPSGNYSPSRSVANNMLVSNHSALLQSDYVALEKSPIAKNNELWRVSLRLGALNDVDYGQFVNSLRGVVEPIVAAYRCRNLVMNAVVAKESTQVKGLVLVLGHKEPPLTGAGRIEGPDRDTAIFAETLRSGLISNSVSKTLWHNPEQSRLTSEQATSTEWANYLSKFDCVVMLNPHADYNLEFIRSHAKHYIDAAQMIQDCKLASVPATQVVATPIELGSNPGQMDVVYTGIVPVVYKAQRTLLESLIWSVAGTFVLIGMVMVCLLTPARTFLSALLPHNILQAMACGFISMIPNVFPLVIVFGLMGHVGTLIDIGTMMTASVALGIAVDDTIHFLTWFRIYLRKGLDRRQAILSAYKDVAPAMTQTTIIGGLGLCVFALSTFTPTQRFGTLMLTLLSVALIGDLIFLPAILSSPLGKLFNVRKSRTDQSEGAVGDSPTIYEADEYRLQDEPNVARVGPNLLHGHSTGSSPGAINVVPEAGGAIPVPKYLSTSPNRIQARKRS